MHMQEPPARGGAGSLPALEQPEAFLARHIGTSDADQREMLDALGFPSRAALIDAIVPAAIRRGTALALPEPVGETEALARLAALAAKNRVLKSFLGQGYHGTVTPGVILRNVLENPAWYTAYTPYQPEISQGRLEALLNFQTMVCDLTGMAIANASMLDEATAAAEAMTLCRRMSRGEVGSVLRGRRRVPADARRRAHARAAARHRGRRRSGRRRRRRRRVRGAAAVPGRPTARCATTARSPRPCTPAAAWSSSPPTSSR